MHLGTSPRRPPKAVRLGALGAAGAGNTLAVRGLGPAPSPGESCRPRTAPAHQTTSTGPTASRGGYQANGGVVAQAVQVVGQQLVPGAPLLPPGLGLRPHELQCVQRRLDQPEPQARQLPHQRRVDVLHLGVPHTPWECRPHNNARSPSPKSSRPFLTGPSLPGSPGPPSSTTSWFAGARVCPRGVTQRLLSLADSTRVITQTHPRCCVHSHLSTDEEHGLYRWAPARAPLTPGATANTTAGSYGGPCLTAPPPPAAAMRVWSLRVLANICYVWSFKL